jgi:Fic family protein
LSEANRAISELNAFGKLIPNVDMFISMHIAKEANQLSRIEGTQTNFEEIFQKKNLLQKKNEMIGAGSSKLYKSNK